jgi:hypothetical protein
MLVRNVLSESNHGILNKKLPADQTLNQQSGDSFDNQFLSFFEKSSGQQYAATLYSANNDGEQFANSQRVIKFDANQELFTKNRLLNHSLKHDLLATKILEPNPLFGSDSQLQHQAQQEQKRLLGRAFSGGSNIDRMHQVHRRRVLTNNPSFSYFVIIWIT